MKKNKAIFKVILVIIFIICFMQVSGFISKITGTAPQFKSNLLEYETQGLVIFADDLLADVTDEVSMKYNTEYLQSLVDEVSNTGGGIIYIPAGTFYFSSDNVNLRGTENYIIKCRDNVTIEGKGTNENTGTVLKPYGTPEYGLDMFYYNDYADSYGTNSKYLENADFRNFMIDGENAKGKTYNSSGKGFMINLYKDCDWELVTVQNTDGTGFGMDNPINCTITKCIAYYCGKNATETDVGASGFGIGTGYSNDESIYINDCVSIGNKKFGFSFEQQGRFDNLYKATKAESLVVENCISSGNLYDYGGSKANDVTYQNCGSYIDYDTGRNKAGFYFEEMSIRINIINCLVERSFSDVQDNSIYYYEPIYWALNNGLVNGINETEFGPLDICTREEVISLLWRLDGCPGDIADQVFEMGFSDVNSNDCTRADFITLLWEYAGSPIVEVDSNFSDVADDASYKDAVNWAVSKGITDGIIEGEFLPDSSCTRGEVITFLHRFSHSNNEFSITYNLMGGELEENNPISYIAGQDTFTLNNPIKKGYTFDGWSGSNCLQNGNLTQIFTPEKEVIINEGDTGNKVYTAKWTPNMYTIVFDPNGGTGEMSEETFVYDTAKVLEPNNFVKDGYDFKEWNTKKDGTGKSYTNVEAVKKLTDIPGEEIILYAQWVKADPENRINIIIGDSFAIEMHNIVQSDDIWIVKRGEGIDWVKNVASNQIENKIDENTNIIITLGTNDLFNKDLNNGNVNVDLVVEKYVKYFNAKAIQWIQKGANVYFVSIGPFDDSKIDNTTQMINNADAIEFNTKIKANLKGITFLDVYSEIVYEFNEKNPDFTRDDGAHGVAYSYSRRYKTLKKLLNQEYTGTYEILENMIDVTVSDSYYEAVKWGYENVYIDPIDSSKFGPNEVLTRADVVTLLWRYQKMPYEQMNNLIFTDIYETDLYYDAIVWGVKNEIITGKTNGIFDPNSNCTRADFITLLWKMAGSPIVQIDNEFTDIVDGSIYEDAINWAVNKGIIRENLTGEFLPEAACSREMVITALYNYNYYYNTKYTVNYDFYTNGGTRAEIDTDELYYGNKVDLSIIAEKEGYEFVGWNTDKNATTGLTKLNIKGEDITLYAIFKKDINITFIDYKGYQKNETIKKLTIYNKDAGSIILPEINEYTDWISNCWAQDGTYDVTQGFLPGKEIGNITKDLKFYAMYEKEILIRFNLNGGIGIIPKDIKGKVYKNSMNIELIKDADIVLPTAEVSKENFIFDGWNTKVGGNGNSFECETIGTFTTDIVLYAKWKAINEFPFTDVKLSDWSYEAIKFVYNRGYILGPTNTTYEPGTKLTRGMIVTILNRMEGYNVVDGKMKFDDVKETEYYYDSVKWATEVGIVHGYEDGYFRPNKFITREELAVILRNYTIYKGEDTNLTADLSKFNDGNKVLEYSKSAVEWAVASGVITGYVDTNTLQPQGTATRDIVASMLYKYCNSYEMDY